mgnify:CR=1 FL=1
MIDLARYRSLYHTEAQRRLVEARAALECGDRGTVQRSFHTLRGMSLMLGFEEVGTRAGRLEEGLFRGELGEAELWSGLEELEEAVLLLASAGGGD